MSQLMLQLRRLLALPTSDQSPLSDGQLIARLVLVAGIIGASGSLFLYMGGWFSPFALTPTTFINRFEEVNGEHSGFRRNHSKGVGITGYFESNGAGAAFSTAVAFTPGRIPILGRFALSGGQPYAADSAHTVRSMALLFQLPDGEEWRTGMNNIPVFAVNSAQGFYEMIKATAPVPVTGKPDPTAVKDFFALHPESAKAVSLIKGQAISSGFDNATFNSLNAFRMTNAAGVVTNVRWAMVPVQPFVAWTATESSPSDNKNQLFDAVIAKIHAGPLQWHLILTIAEPGDPTADATIPWPPDRKQIDVGTLTITDVESEDTSPARDINYDPLVLPSGIAGSDDPLLSARSAAYAVSFTRRESEQKSPSSVSPAETKK